MLPLENPTGDTGQDYFVDGITEALINELGRLHGLRVISRTSVMRYKGARKPLPEIARELGVEAVLEGSVQRAGERVRISAQLIDAGADRHLWNERYERALRDVLLLQAEIAASVSREVKVALTSEEQAHLSRARPVDPWAHELYLKGRQFWSKRTPEALQAALTHFEEAARTDPAYAPAWAGIADTLGILGTGPQGALESRQAMTRARDAALKALVLDDSLAEARASLGWIRYRYDWDWTAAKREFQRAIELSPGYVTAHYWYANFLIAMGRPEHALVEARRAADLDPLSPLARWLVAVAFYSSRRWDESMAQTQRVLELDPDYAEGHRLVGELYLQQGRMREAREAFERAGMVTRPFMLATLGAGYAHAGNRAEARRILADLSAASRTRYVTPVAFAMLHAALGENDAAFSWLDRAFAERSDFMVWLKASPLFDDLRGDPRFADALRRMRFPDEPERALRASASQSR